MSKLSCNLVSMAAAAACAGVVASASANQVIYNNSVTSQDAVFFPGTTEVGNEIYLGRTERTLTKFSFQYSTSPTFSGGVNATLRFYQNTGAPVGALFAPGASPFFTENFTFQAWDAASSGQTMNFVTGADFGPTGLNLPSSTLTWTIQFSDNTVGLDLFAPPSVGNADANYWAKNGGTWQVMSNSLSPNMVFGAYMETPEPSSMSLLFGGGMILFMLKKFRRKD